MKSNIKGLIEWSVIALVTASLLAFVGFSVYNKVAENLDSNEKAVRLAQYYSGN